MRTLLSRTASGAAIAAVGTVAEFSIPSGHAIKALKRGSDGNVWFITSGVSAQSDALGFVTPAGAVTEYQVPSSGGATCCVVAGTAGTAVGSVATITLVSGSALDGVRKLSLNRIGGAWCTKPTRARSAERPLT